jgi:hypothetical protein
MHDLEGLGYYYNYKNYEIPPCYVCKSFLPCLKTYAFHFLVGSRGLLRVWLTVVCQYYQDPDEAVGVLTCCHVKVASASCV